MFVCMNVCMYACMYIRMYVCMYVYLYMYVCICVCICISRHEGKSDSPMTFLFQGETRQIRHKDLLTLRLKWHHDTQLMWRTMRRLDIRACDRVFSTDVQATPP